MQGLGGKGLQEHIVFQRVLLSDLVPAAVPAGFVVNGRAYGGRMRGAGIMLSVSVTSNIRSYWHERVSGLSFLEPGRNEST